MTAENQNEPPAQGERDGVNLGIQGSVDDSIVVGGDQNTIQKTIHQGPSYYTTNIFGASQAGQGSEKSDYLRRNLLKQMKTDVALRLDDSLHNLIRVDLAQEEQRHQVGRRRKEALVAVTPTSPLAAHELVQRELAVSDKDAVREPIPPAEQTFKIFHRADIGGRLLILGEPGAGKTTELLTVSQRLVDRAIEDSTQPIPLIFELSSWQPNTPILSWLGQQLKQAYGVSKKLAEPFAQQLIQQGQLLPLLDGLDELGQRNQIECIKALEEFLAQHPALPVIICCRREEYEQGRSQLNQLNGAIYLQAVGSQQIQQYLQDLGRELLWEGIQADPELLKLARSPLFLTMLVIAYQGQPIRDTSSLFHAYIRKQLHEPSNQGTYKPGKAMSPEQTLHYLSWLARQLNQRNETEFLIENLQPDWLENKQQQRTYRILGTSIN